MQDQINAVQTEMQGQVEAVTTNMQGKLETLQNELKETREDYDNLKDKIPIARAHEALNDFETRTRIKQVLSLYQTCQHSLFFNRG